MVCNADFVCDKDVTPVCDDGRPEDGHACAHYSEIDFEAGDDQDFGIPPGKIKALSFALTMLEGAPKTEDSHEYDAEHVSDNYEIRQTWLTWNQERITQSWREPVFVSGLA